MFNRGRIIFAVITLMVLFAWQEPLIFAISSFILVLGWLLISKGLIPFLDNVGYNSEQEARRKAALYRVKMFLAPYKSIWKDLKLSNKNCFILLDNDGVSITVKEKIYPYRKFKVVTSHVHTYTDLWDMFCLNFSHNKTYDDLVKDSNLYRLSIYEYPLSQTIQEEVRVSPAYDSNVEKLDINNCSEIELTELPGISIVMAKKAIKKREEIGGFKTIEEFFGFMKLKPHMEQQLREKVCVKKMKGARKKVERNSERRVDL